MFKLLILSIFLVSVNCVDPHTVDFFEGFGEGLETDFGDLQKCLGDMNITKNDLVTGVADIVSGVKTRNILKIAMGLEYFGEGLKEIQVAVQDCGAEKLAEDLICLVHDFSSGGAIIEWAIKELKAAWTHASQLFTEFIAAEQAFASGNYFKAGYYVGEIVGLFLQNGC